MRIHEGSNPELLTAMMTPYYVEGKYRTPHIDFDSARAIASFLIDNGSDGLVLAGTTGESPVMSHDDQLRLFREVRDEVGEDAVLIGGTGSNATHEALELSDRATEDGAIDGLLVVSPYYNRPAQYGIENYYRYIREMTDLDIILYNIPSRTGKKVEDFVIDRLFEEGVINAVKDATGNTEMAAVQAARHGDNAGVYSGDDGLNLEFAEVVTSSGHPAAFKGAISVASHYAGNVMREFFDAVADADNERAKKLHQKLVPFYEFESVHKDDADKSHDVPNPIPTRVMMELLLGECFVGDFVSPMEADPEEIRYLKQRGEELLSQL